MNFKIADNLTLPAGAIADTIAVVGTRGSGKSYTASKITETFLDGGAQVVVVDPCGIWWGLRLAADGKRPGIDIPVLGGYHGDIPLEPTGGELVARLVAERGMSAVLDVSEFTMGEQRRFVVAFARALFELKKRNRSPLHVVLEEAHEFLPQQVDAGAAEMVGVVKRIWKIGRNFGIGGTLVSQRPAEMNKGALNLTSTMIVGKLKGPLDRRAIELWAKDQDADDRVIAELPTLQTGNMLVWRDSGVARMRAFPKRTFDSSKTPEAGDFTPGAALPRIDLGEVRTAMAATIEEAKASDPKALRARIAELERGQVAPPAPRVEEWIVYRLPPGTEAAIAVMRDNMRTVIDGLKIIDVELMALAETTSRAAADMQAATQRRATRATPAPGAVVRSITSRPAATNGAASHATPPSDGDGSMRILRALAARHPTPLTKAQVGTLAVLKPKGGSFRTYVSKLVVGGLISRDGVFLKLTPEGIAAAGPILRPSTPGELVALWRDRLTGKARDMLEVFAEGEVWTKATLGQRVDLDVAGGSFRTYLSKLKANGLIEKVPGGFQAVQSLRAN